MERELKTPLSIAGLNFEPDFAKKLIVGEELQMSLSILLGMTKDGLVPVNCDRAGNVITRDVDLSDTTLKETTLSAAGEEDLGDVYNYHLGFDLNDFISIQFGMATGVYDGTVYPQHCPWTETAGGVKYHSFFSFWADCRYVLGAAIQPVGAFSCLLKSYKFNQR